MTKALISTRGSKRVIRFIFATVVSWNDAIQAIRLCQVRGAFASAWIQTKHIGLGYSVVGS